MTELYESISDKPHLTPCVQKHFSSFRQNLLQREIDPNFT